MKLEEIMNNINNLDKVKKEELIEYVYTLAMNLKRIQNKTISLNGEIRFLKRHMTKIRDMIDRTLKTNIETENVGWYGNDD